VHRFAIPVTAAAFAVAALALAQLAPGAPAAARDAPVPDGYRVISVARHADGYEVVFRVVTPSGEGAVLARTADPEPRSDPLIQEWTGYSGNGVMMLCATSDRAPRVPDGQEYVNGSCGVTVVRRRAGGVTTVAAGPGPVDEIKALAAASALRGVSATVLPLI
jgi:hypothetical protein